MPNEEHLSVEWTVAEEAKAQEIVVHEHAVMVHGNAARYFDRLQDKAAATRVRARGARSLQRLRAARTELARLMVRPASAI